MKRYQVELKVVVDIDADDGSKAVDVAYKALNGVTGAAYKVVHGVAAEVDEYGVVHVGVGVEIH